MMLSLECRTRCPMCGYFLSCFAFSTVRVNKRSFRQLPGLYLRTNPGRCPECWFDGCLRAPAAPTGSFTATLWTLTASSAAEVDAYRARRWPELAAA